MSKTTTTKSCTTNGTTTTVIIKIWISEEMSRNAHSVNVEIHQNHHYQHRSHMYVAFIYISFIFQMLFGWLCSLLIHLSVCITSFRRIMISFNVFRFFETILRAVFFLLTTNRTHKMLHTKLLNFLRILCILFEIDMSDELEVILLFLNIYTF